MRIGAGLEKVIDVLGEILAFLTVALFIILSINHFAGFLPAGVVETMNKVLAYAALTVVGLKGLEFALKHGFVVFLIYAVLIAAAVVFIFCRELLPAHSAYETLQPFLPL